MVIWLLLNGNPSTKGFLVEMGIINYEDAICLFCCEEIETINHLFHHCSVLHGILG